MKNLVILGGGTAGTMMSAKLRRKLDREQWRITLVDRDDLHIYQPGLLFVPFGVYRSDEIVKSRARYVPPGVDLRFGDIERIEPDTNKVHMKDGAVLDYDFLVVATGSRIVPEETEGLLGSGWQKNVFDFYTLDGASKLFRALDRFEGGRLVLNVVEMPIKCPVAPLEFLFLADWFFTERRMRDKVEIVYATPLDGAFTKPKASEMLGGLLQERGINVEPMFAAGEVDGERSVLKSWDDRELPFDMLVTIPTHMGAEAIETSDLGDELAFMPTDPNTLQAKAAPNIFVLGDATDLPTSKAGSVAHFQGEVLEENVLRAIDGRELCPDFDGHASCFIETGFGKAVLIDFNYETEPLPGRFPLPGVGPMRLLEESEMNHWGKMAFRWIYWNVLLKGGEMPFIGAQMSRAGKWS